MEGGAFLITVRRPCRAGSPLSTEAPMGDFLAFRKMITPVVVQILFWLGVLGCVATAVAIMSGNSPLAAASPVSPQIAGVIILVVGPLLIRFYCELLIVVFRMYDSMRAIERNTAKG
jgi:hypothetical protein